MARSFEDRPKAEEAEASASLDFATAVGRTSLAADDPNALEQVYGDQHHDPHASRYEHHHAHAEQHHAKIDRFNHTAIEDHANKHVAGRPGVVWHGRGLFMVNKPHVKRYLYTKENDVNIATPFDVVDRDALTTNNTKTHGTRVLVNPSLPRRLVIDGVHHTCVLTWVDAKSAAWMRVDDLEHGEQIAEAARHRAQHEDPAAAGHDPHALLDRTVHYVVRNDAVGEAGPGDSPHGHARVLGPGMTSGDNLEHYLSKDLRKPGFDASGHQLGQNVTRSLVSLCMNLPEGQVPPVAIDTMLAGESFFVMKDRTFHRTTPVYESGAHHANLLETWVYGFAGMLDSQGHMLPDPSRRGWVPFRVLADARHLEVHTKPQT